MMNKYSSINNKIKRLPQCCEVAFQPGRREMTFPFNEAALSINVGLSGGSNTGLSHRRPAFMSQVKTRTKGLLLSLH